MKTTNLKSMLSSNSAPLSSAIFGLMFWLSAFPGWMSGDSYTQWVEASGQFLVSDMHSAQLSRAWSYLLPYQLGPIIPFSFQVLSFFVGLFLFLKWISERSVFISWLALIAVALMPFTWTVAWIWKDAYLISMTLLSTGLFLSASNSRNRPFRLFQFILSALILGLASIGRIYMFPALIFWAVCLLFLVFGTKAIWGKLVAFVLVSAIPFVGIGIIWPSISKPFPSFHSASTQLLDLARLECRGRSVEESTPIEGILPRNFIVNSEVADICSQYNPYFWDNIVWTNPEEVHVRVPNSDKEAAILFQAWKDAVFAHPNSLLAAKIEAFNEMLTLTDFPEVPHHESQPYRYGGMGLSLNNERPYGGFFPSRGGALLAAVATPADLFVSTFPELYSGLLWIILLPLLVLTYGYLKHQNFRRIRYTPILFSGLVWGILATAVSPAIVTRYLSVGIMMNFLAIFLVVTIFATQGKQPQK